MADHFVELAASTASLVDGTYVLGNVIGRGGMGVVYSATQMALGRRVAIKIPHAELASNPFAIRRFQTEARAGGRLAHRNIVRVIDFGGRDDAPFLVMEYVAGVALDTLVAEQGAMTTPVAADLVTQVLAALHGAHTAGIVHADIKSANVLVEMLPDETLIARVIDFGLAVFIDEPFVNNQRLVSGTPEYLAPEIVSGERPTIASDIYAAGVMLYELLTGSTPFGGGSTAEILERHLHDVAVPPSLRAPDQDISATVETVVMRALARDPRARFASAAECSAALRSAVPAEPAGTARSARGTVGHALSTENPTLDWHLDEPSPSRAASVAVGKNLHIAKVRLALADAIASNQGDSIVASYLELVRLFVDDHGLAAAARELEEGLALLKRNRLANDVLPATWRLQLCLAGLYSGLGDRACAQTAARVGHDLAVAASSELGQQRAAELLTRLAGRGGSVKS